MDFSHSPKVVDLLQRLIDTEAYKPKFATFKAVTDRTLAPSNGLL